MKTLLGAFALLAVLFWAAPRAHANGVTTCTDPSKSNTSVMSCLSSLVYAPTPIAPTTLVLVCPQGSAGLQDQSQCPGNVWRLLASVQPTDLIGYCAQAQLTPYTACDYPNGKEGFVVASSIGLGSSSAPTPPVGSATGPAQISWSAPTVDSAGNPVTVSGYIIQYGTTDFSYSQSVSALVTTYTFNSLAAGTWQFRVVALDASGGRSAPSTPVTLVIGGSSAGTCAAAPATATQTVACPTGTTGTWTQTHGWTSAAYPTCWTANAWSPTSAPAGACTTAAVTWKTSAAESVFEAVLPVSGSALVQGNSVGTVAAGKTCGAEVYKIGTASYRRISDSDASLRSPTYAGRVNTAVCTGS